MTTESDNCIVCAEEFPVNELKSVALSTVQVTRFKICKNCLDHSDPADDYRSVRAIVYAFLDIEKLLK